MRHWKWLRGSIVLAGICVLLPTQRCAADHGKKLDELLSQGKLADAQKYFEQVAAKDAADGEARVALGLTQFLQAIEGLAQDNFRFGLLNQHARNLPLARMPVPLNDDPEQISYEKLRGVVERFAARLALAESSLAEAKTAAIQIPLYIGRVRLDLDGNQAYSEDETLWKVFAAINSGVEPKQGEEFFIGVDSADVHWLRGYCHFLMAFCDVALAYDERPLFERCAQLLFPNVDSPFRVAQEGAKDPEDFPPTMFLDGIAAIHLVNFKLIDKARMASAHAHLVSMIEQSRLSWERAENEMDDDHEWIPNDRQTGVLQVRVSRDVITGWHKVLAELDAILQGKKLVPYWRMYFTSVFRTPEFPDTGTGINLQKVFLEPRDFDLVLTIQGTNVEPYLEEGSLSTPEAWTEMTRVFGGQFFGFAIWFN